MNTMKEKLPWSVSSGTVALMKKLNLKGVIWKEGKFFVAQCLNVDISSFGKSRKAALSNLQEAIELYFDGAKKSLFRKSSHHLSSRRNLDALRKYFSACSDRFLREK